MANTTKTTWTGRTAKAELADRLYYSSPSNPAHGIEDLYEAARNDPEGSLNRQMISWWESVGPATQTRLLAEVRRRVRQRQH